MKLQVCIFTLFTILCLPLEIIDWSVVTLTIRIYSSPSTNQRPAAYQHVKLRRDIELTGRQTRTTRQEGRRYTDPIQIVYRPTPFDNVSLFVYFYLHVSLLTTRMFFTTFSYMYFVDLPLLVVVKALQSLCLCHVSHIRR